MPKDLIENYDDIIYCYNTIKKRFFYKKDLIKLK